jgi:YhcH/YjgK/YiaL family protein
MKEISNFLLITMFTLFVLNVSAQENDNKKPSQEASEWFNQKIWLQGLDLKPSESIDVNEFYKQYQANKEYWEKAFAFLKSHDLEKLPAGKYPIDGELVYATVTQTPTKDFDKTKWESHRRYIDFQYVISGEEKIGVCKISNASISSPYDVKKDVANYQAEGEMYTAKPGTFFIFFNNDAHRPGITTGGNKTDKKIVIKIRAAE